MEKKVKITDKNGSLICFYENDDGSIDVRKNNHQDISTLTLENAKELMMFLNTILS